MVAISLTVSALLAVIFGILILMFPKMLNNLVGLWLLVFGILQLINIYY
ncbi:MAG: DUF3096 domain-containing protein [archaeon]